MDKKLEVKNLQISFRTQGGILKAVRNISFDLHRGETLAIVGESGSGKSVTSKSIMGILSGNSIVEGGEILYDGQDLLKISEDDMHKIRGDKIAMIFQDPMSSLNPIMRIGRQLTEAMILKNKTSKRNAKTNFRLITKKLSEAIKLNDEVKLDEKEFDELFNVFEKFFINSTKLEDDYNDALSKCIEAEVDLDDLIFMIEKHQKVDVLSKLKDISHCHFNAPTAMLVCYNKNECWTRRYDGKTCGVCDASIVTTHMMLMAHTLGVGTTWVMSFNPEKMKKAYNIPENVEPVALLVMGYPAPDASPMSLHSEYRDIKEVVVYDKF